MKKGVLKKAKFIKAVTTFALFSVLVVAVASYFAFNERLIGIAFLALGLFDIFLIYLFKIKLSSIYPDIIFGLVDNSVMVFAVVLGISYAGVVGAIIGGAAGNTVTDGIGGLFEGHIADNQRKYKIDNKRTALSTSLGKMAGCLFGAGFGLLLVYFISLI
jgi:hypothetical protein